MKCLKTLTISLLFVFALALTANAAPPVITVTKGNPTQPTAAPYNVFFKVTDDTGIVGIYVDGEELGAGGATYYGVEWQVYGNDSVFIEAVDSEGFSTTETINIANVYSPYEMQQMGIAPAYQSEYETHGIPSENVTAPVPETTAPTQAPETQLIQETTAEPVPESAEAVTEEETSPEETAPEETIPEETAEEETETEPEIIETVPEVKDPMSVNLLPLYRAVKRYGNQLIVDIPEKPDFSKVYARAEAAADRMKISVPTANDMRSIYSAALKKGYKFVLDIPTVKPVLMAIYDAALGKGSTYKISIPHINFDGSRGYSLQSADGSTVTNRTHGIKDIYTYALKKGREFTLSIPGYVDVSEIYRIALATGRNFEISVPAAVNFLAIYAYALGIGKELQIQSGIPGIVITPDTMINVLTSTELQQTTTMEYIIVAILAGILLYQIWSIALNFKKLKLYKMFINARNHRKANIILSKKETAR